MKRLICMVLSALIVFSTFITAFGADEYPVESAYNQTGSHKVQSIEYEASGFDAIIPSSEENFKNYKIWYPADMENSTIEYPVIIYCNGTNTTYKNTDSVSELMEYIASWGFIAATNDDASAGSGKSTSMTLSVLYTLDKAEKSIFSGKIDRDKIGLAGHSQGGSGVINAASEWKFNNSRDFRSVYAASTPHYDLANSEFQNSPYDVSKLSIPCFFTAGTGSSDAGDDKNTGICPLDLSLKTNAYYSGSDNVIIGRIKGMEHKQMIYAGKAYMMAWFFWTLLDDPIAATAFDGENAELFKNENWQDVMRKQDIIKDDVINANDKENNLTTVELFFKNILAFIKLFLSDIKTMFNG